jgi:hypothetical protein
VRSCRIEVRELFVLSACVRCRAGVFDCGGVVVYRPTGRGDGDAKRLDWCPCTMYPA